MTEYEQTPEPDETAAKTASDASSQSAGGVTDMGDAAPADEAAEAAEKAKAESAWSEVVGSLDDLGKAVGDWARAVKDDPRNRERATELKTGLEGLGKQLGDMIDTASKSDVGQQIGDVASKTGDAVVDVAKSVGDAVGPHVAGAFRSIADALHGAADRMGQRDQAGSEVPPAPDSAPEPPPAPPAPPAPPREPED